MYSDKLETLFKKNKIEIGDRIKINNKDKILEGVLMPRPDSGNDNIIIIKLSNGYNVGIKYIEGVILEKLSGHSKEEFSFPKIKSNEYSKSNDKISLIYTGGTIGSKACYRYEILL